MRSSEVASSAASTLAPLTFPASVAAQYGGGLTAAGLLVLLLAFIGLGVGIYYAYICLRARPLRSKPPTDSERGPLINPDPDVNGNHEDAPLEASAPVDDVNIKYKTPLDEPDISNGQVKSLDSDPPENAIKSSKTPKPKNEILVPTENEALPAKIVHEKEVVPSLNRVAPLMLVNPAVLQETLPDCHPQQNIRPIPQPQPEAEVQPTRNTPAPVYISVPHAKKPLTLSDEEDGLLLPECVPQNASIDSEHCPKPISFISQDEVPNSTKHEIPEASNLPHKENQFQSDPVFVLSHTASAPPMPETPTSEPAQPLPSSQPAEPEVTVVPQQPAPGYGWNEDVTPVGKAVEPVSPELLNKKLSPLLMQEDIEQIQPVQDTHCLVPINEVKLDMSEKNSNDKNNSQPEPPEISPQSILNNENTPKIPEEASGKLVEYPPLVYLETSPPPEHSCVSSTSSEEAVPPYTEPSERKISKTIIAEEARPETPTGSSLHNLKRQPLLADNCEPVTVTLLESSVTNPAEASNSPNKPASLKDLSKAQTDDHLQASNIPDETLADIPFKASAGISAEALEDIPLENCNIPLEICNIPLEAYIPNIDEEYDIDSTEGDSTSLPIIKEEDSIGTESECVETDSSEPEVTEYSFASGPSAPSTSVVLADEVSCTLEPEVTKYVVISDTETSCDSDLSESENSDDDPNKVNSDILPGRPKSYKLDSIYNNEETIQANPDSSKDKPDSSSHSLPFVKDAAPSTIKPDDSALNVLAVVTISNDGHAQSPDSTNILSKHDSNSEGSDTESEGAEAEAELREEEVTVPTAVHEAPPKFISTSTKPETYVVKTMKTPVGVCDPCPQKSIATKVQNKPLQEISNSTEDISSSSCTSDLSDDDITTSTPKKSKIPRLVNYNES